MHRNCRSCPPAVITYLIYLSLSSSNTEILADNLHDATHEHKFVSGKSVEYLPDPIFYDTYVPILFKVPIPKHTDDALTLLWGDVKNCTKSVKGKFCPVAYHLFKVIKKLGDDMSFWKPYYVNHTTANRRESSKKRTGYDVICNEIGPHFYRSYTSAVQMNNYVKALKICSRMEQKVQIHAPPGNWVVNKAVYYKMLESYIAQYFNDMPTKVDLAVTLNTYTSIHGLLLTNHVMESVRLATAFRICQNSLIPETFVSMSMLKDVIQTRIQQSLGRWNYQLVYSHLEQDIEEYYKLPIADCTFSDDYSFIIRILVPVKRSELSHKLVQITAIPFLEKLPSTSGIPERLCRLKLPASKLTLIESSEGLLLDTSCEPNQLCKTSEVSTVFENDACTASILTETSDRELITNTCKFSCFTVADNTFPLIRRISSDTYIVVGSVATKIYINCFDKPSEMIPIHLRDIGALRIQLACQCHILYSTHVSYRPQEPCSGNTIVEHILPYHWYNKQLNSTLDKTNNEFETGVVYNDTIDNINSTTELIEIDDAQIEKSVAKQEEEWEKFQDQNVHIPKQTHYVESHMSDGLVVQLCILWVLVIFLGMATAYLGYQVRKLTKWREFQSYKETRIVYRIPETPDENKIVNKF